ncbi:hypothetical protein BDV93DRAFT_522892 [Ceratobasidium sp. AG-I]|nr:hypothetical protein BDV93DRAFT_522892 [Ceratobasidium sp. AG-I]
MSVSTKPLSATDQVALILSGKPITLSTIQTTISLAQTPSNLPAFFNRDLIGACMRLLRTRASTPDTPYELACVRLISISLLVFLLGAGVQGFVDFATRKLKSAPSEKCLTLLGGHIAYMQLEGMEVTEGMVERNAGVRGISDADAEYLIVLLYEKRDVVLRVRRDDPESCCGLTSLYYILWYRSVRAIRDPKISLQLRDVICRFGLVAAGPESNEDVLLFSIVDRIDRFPTRDLVHERNIPVDPTDMRTIVQCYIERVTPSPASSSGASAKDLPPLQFCKELLKWMCLGLVKNGQPTLELHLLVSIVEASIPRLWLALESKVDVGPLHRAVHMAFLLETYVYIPTFLRDDRMKSVDKAKMMNILVEGDWMNLVGRVIMLGMLDGPDPVSVDIIDKTIHMINDKRQATQTLVNDISRHWKPSQKAYSNACRDWIKTYAHIVNLQGAYSRPLPRTFRQYLRDSELEWFQLGETLGFTARLEQDDSRCEYTRCPYLEELVTNSCGGCEKVRYCCVECQNADWSFRLHPHRAACLGE